MGRAYDLNSLRIHLYSKAHLYRWAHHLKELFVVKFERYVAKDEEP